MINISYLPNITWDDFSRTVKIFLQPWCFTKGKCEVLLKRKIRKLFPGRRVYLLSSGRGALWAILRSLSLEEDDEVIVQAFTCCAVINPVLSCGARPVYVDIDENYNLDLNDFTRKITNKTKAVIIQHTFGIPAAVDKIIEIAKKNKIYVI